MAFPAESQSSWQDHWVSSLVAGGAKHRPSFLVCTIEAILSLVNRLGSDGTEFPVS